MTRQTASMPYVVLYCMLDEGVLSPWIQGVYPGYAEAKAWVGDKKGYSIRELPEMTPRTGKYMLTVHVVEGEG